jgi:Mg/Co/Ni transporter MgtE
MQHPNARGGNVTAEIVPAESGALETRQATRLAAEEVAVKSLVRAVITGCAVAVPLCIAIWIGVVAWAVGDDGPSWGVWIGMACAVGILAGSFYGGWAGFVAKAHLLDDLDELASHGDGH